MSLAARVATLIVAVFAVAGGAIFAVAHYLLGGPPTVDFAAGPSGQVSVVMQTDASSSPAAVPDHPTWVSYFIRAPATGRWIHTTLFQVPAHTRVNVTIFGYDGSTPVRNQYWGQVTGTVGGVAHYGGKPVQTVNGWNGPYLVQHTFAIPGLNLNVPVEAGPATCTAGPCTGNAHSTTTFSFETPAQPGAYRWQCFVPCGLSYLDGNGGPMQTIGYMTGNMQVAS
ncbi:MAG: hypothetical protein JO016_09480 [Actinobacteria bacterium]|nr:hypothetical protein [Actinomycetota bacterium]